MFRKFIKDSVIYVLPAIVSRGLSFFLVPLYTRVLSPSDYGSLDMLTVFASIINLTIALEVSQGLARYYAGGPASWRKVAYASTAFWFTFFCYSIFAVLALLYLPHYAHLIMGQHGLEKSFQLGIIFIWSNGLFYLIQNQFRWEFRSRDYVIVSLLMSFITAASSILFAFWLRWGLEGMLLGMVMGSLVGTGFGLWLLQTSFRFQFDTACLRDMLVFSTPLVFSGVAVWVSLYIDRIMINRLLSVEAVGIYGVGYRVASIAGLVMVGFQGALTPLVYAHHQNPSTPSQLARIFRFFMFVALFVFLSMSLFAQDIVGLLTTGQFFDGAFVVVYLVPAIFFANMYTFAPGICISRRTHLTLWINIGGALLNITMNYILIPFFGIIGAGLATLVSSLIVFVVYMTISQRLYYVPHRWLPIISTAIFVAVLSHIAPQISSDKLSNLTINFVFICIFFVICIIFRLIRYDELRRLIIYMSKCI